MSANWLTYVSLSDSYERKTRFLPAVLTMLFLTPILFALKLPVPNWLSAILSGVGISAVISVGLSHIASAFGNRFQRRLWPRWPHDAPTNVWLNPKDTTRSKQQRALWYGVLRRLTDLDIESAIVGGDEGDIEAVINDAVTNLRNQLWSSEVARRLRIHNEDYGFARNFAGLRSVWLIFSLVSTLACWLGFVVSYIDLNWPLVSTAITMIAFVLAFRVLPEYVRRKAYHYAETFFAAASELDKTNRS